MNNILIFKTSIRTDCDKLRIQETLDSLDSIQQWNIDLHDVDRVLRIVSDTLRPEQVISIISYHGFDCTELE